MSIELAVQFLLWCTILNYAMLLLWFIFFMSARDFMMRLHGRWFKMTGEQFDAIHYAGMAFYKIGIFLFNLAPLVALCIMRG